MADEMYRFGEYELDIARLQLRRDGEPVHVEPRAFDLLCHLVLHRDRTVPKTELLDEVWGDRFVSEAALTTVLRTARLAVGDTGGRQRLIRTVHRRGYQFVAPATVAGSGRRLGPVTLPARGWQRPGGRPARTARSSGSAGPRTAPASPMPPSAKGRRCSRRPTG
jgi:DNA-binding winged helix-turn-helix (wHTH) protein